MCEIIEQYSADTIIQNVDKFVNHIIPPYMRGSQ